jgi:hypothetical protein
MGDHLERTVALNQNRPPSPFLFPADKPKHRPEQDRCRPRKAGPEKPGESPEEEGKYTRVDAFRTSLSSNSRQIADLLKRFAELDLAA